MILVNEMPKSGQFVAVWTNEDGIWSDSYMWEDGKLMEYDINDPDGWFVCGYSTKHIGHLKDAVFVLQSPKT